MQDVQSVTDNRQNYNDAGMVRVWDLFIRIFHWATAAGFAAAFISGEIGADMIHVWTGYLLCLLLLARLYSGFRGSEYARFRSFFFSPAETAAYVRGMLSGQPGHYYGHNPAGALMVFTMLVLLLLIILSGLLTLAAIDYEGPLLFLANRVSDAASYVFRDIHHILPILALVLVVLHLIGVAAGSIQHRENLVRAMLTGKKKPHTPQIPKK